MNFVRLTAPSGATLWINLDRILAMIRDDALHLTYLLTAEEMPANPYRVKESPETILLLADGITP